MQSVERRRGRGAWQFVLMALVLVAIVPTLASSEPDPVLATVNGESITLDDLYRELENFHRTVEDPSGMVHRPKLSSLLDRLISARLIVQEARNIGLDELEEYQRVTQTYRRGVLRRMVLDQEIGEIVGDPELVQEIEDRLVTRYRILGALIESKEEAEQLRAQAAAGEDLAALIAGLTERGLAKPTDPETLYRPDELLPEVLSALSTMEPGELTPVVPVRHVFAVARLLAVERLEDPDALAMAEDEAKRVALDVAKQAFIASLTERYVKVDRELFDRLDLDVDSAGFVALKSDDRPLATIEGAEPITVGEFCSALEQQFFHGVEQAAEGGKLSRRKERVLNELIGARVTLSEADRREIDQTAEFRQAAEVYSDGLLFSMFVQRVIEPEIEVTDDDLRSYMKAHIDEFTTPEMMQLDALIFAEEQTARRALDKLNRGADFEWTRTNTPGQIEPNTPGLLSFRPMMPVVVSELPPQLQQALSGASQGDFRFVTRSPDGPYYVVWVRNLVPAETQPFEAVKEGLRRPVFFEKRQQTIDDWVEQLRAASDVEVVVDGPQLAELVGFGGSD